MMFLTEEERNEMDRADWRLYHYKIKKMDVFAQRGLFVCLYELGLMVPAVLLMHDYNTLALIIFIGGSLPVMISFAKMAWWFFDDRAEMKIWRDAKAKKQSTKTAPEFF